MGGRVVGGMLERLDDVRGGPDVGVAAPEVDQRLALLGGCPRDPGEELPEVLLREALEAGGTCSHGGMLVPGGHR
jgi:hypothetical protein